MCKYLLDHHRVLDTCNYLDGTTACVTGRYIDIEYSFQALRPGHSGVTVCRLAVARLTVFLTLVAFTAFRRRHQRPVLAVWRKHAMESGQVSSRPGYQSCQARHEIQWLEDNVGSAVSVRCLQLVADVAV